VSTDEPHDGQLETEIAALAVSPASAACVWLGQGGYLFKSPRGTTVMVDAYLSDYAAEFWGVTRAIPPVVDPARIKPDVFLVTHWHEDHLDAPTVRHYAQQPDVVFAGPESCVIRARIWGWPAERTVTLERGDRHQFDDVHVTATFARHDEDAALTLDAVGFLLDFGGVRIWNVADSEYDARLRPMRDAGIDVMLVPINGVGGNMNTHEAALLTWHVAPRIAIPMHYGMWPDEQYGAGATLDPETYRQTLTRLGGTAEVRVLEPGEIVVFAAR
jgi:L-ascorbate metabolism protein UlaG (beta-lactamase superfamily)